MMRKGNTCRTSYSSSEAPSNAATGAPNKWAVHAWTTSEFDDDFPPQRAGHGVRVDADPGGVSGRGFLCATLVERHESGGVPSDTTIASTTYDVSAWPVDPAPAELHVHRVPAGRHRRGQPARAGAAPARRSRRRTSRCCTTTRATSRCSRSRPRPRSEADPMSFFRRLTDERGRRAAGRAGGPVHRRRTGHRGRARCDRLATTSRSATTTPSAPCRARMPGSRPPSTRPT